jgi:hypothetical protein
MSSKNILIYLVLVVASFFVFACKSTGGVRSRAAMYKAIYVNEFKLIYFRQLLIKSYNNSTSVQEIIRADHSGFTEPILGEDDYNLIDSLTTIDNERMKIDSTEGNFRAEGAQGKRPLGFILDRLNGKWLDSLSRRRLKIIGVPADWTK